MHSCEGSVCLSHDILCICVYLPMYRDGEDGVDVGQHCFEMLRILLEAHFRQYQGLANVLNGKIPEQK